MSVLSLIPEDKRKDNRKESLETVYRSTSRLSLLNKRKRLNPLAMDISTTSLNKNGGDKYVTQRVLSAKTHRVKQLQNQLSDAHYHLQELGNENKILRAIQKKQEIALQRYENSNAELPQVLNSHTEEIRIQQSKYKQLKQQFKDATLKLKERDMQLQQLRDEHNHLLELSRDRNLLEREKLQSQLNELSLRVQQQNETITTLQRRIVLEAKNFKHQLQMEINKHKDTRHDLDLAINNADKLSTIIEMKEKMLSTVACRTLKSPVKTSSSGGSISISKQTGSYKTSRSETDTTIARRDDRANLDQNILAKMCENSRNVSSALSHEEDTSSSTEPRSRYGRSRTNSTSTRSTPNPGTRKSSKSSEEIMDLAKTVQYGMADLAIFDDELKTSPDELHKKMEVMKSELMKKIKSEDSGSRRPSALRRKSPEASIEEQAEIQTPTSERPKSRARRNSTVSFYADTPIEEAVTTVAVHEEQMQVCVKRENSALTDRTIAGKPIDKYCKDIIQGIEKSSIVIDNHMKNFNQSRFESDKLVQQLQAVDKINEYVMSNAEIPESAINELNNNFKMLSDNVFTEVSTARKRSITSRRPSRDSRNSLLGDSMTNQEMLEDLLGKK